MRSIPQREVQVVTARTPPEEKDALTRLSLSSAKCESTRSEHTDTVVRSGSTTMTAARGKEVSRGYISAS